MKVYVLMFFSRSNTWNRGVFESLQEAQDAAEEENVLSLTPVPPGAWKTLYAGLWFRHHPMLDKGYEIREWTLGVPMWKEKTDG